MNLVMFLLKPRGELFRTEDKIARFYALCNEVVLKALQIDDVPMYQESNRLIKQQINSVVALHDGRHIALYTKATKVIRKHLDKMDKVLNTNTISITIPKVNNEGQHLYHCNCNKCYDNWVKNGPDVDSFDGGQIEWYGSFGGNLYNSYEEWLGNNND